MSTTLVAIALLLLGLAHLLLLIWLGLLIRTQLDQVQARLFGLEVEWKKLNDLDSAP